jgi:hypothetical protein
MEPITEIMSYRKGTTNNYHSRAKKVWLRAEKKRRMKAKKQAREVAARLLGDQSFGNWFLSAGYYTLERKIDEETGITVWVPK